MKLITFKELYDRAVSVLGFKKVLITALSGFAGWCVCSTAALAIVPDNPQAIEQPVTETVQTVAENIIEKENV